MPFSRTGTIVLLDDAEREDESAALKEWREHYGDAIDVALLPGFTKGLAAIVVLDPGAPGPPDGDG
jgi:hypothetical protein